MITNDNDEILYQSEDSSATFEVQSIHESKKMFTRYKK